MLSEKAREDEERRKSLGIRCISLYCDQDENYQKDDTKCYFYFHDYINRLEYHGALEWIKIFELLKPYLTVKRES